MEGKPKEQEQILDWHKSMELSDIQWKSDTKPSPLSHRCVTEIEPKWQKIHTDTLMEKNMHSPCSPAAHHRMVSLVRFCTAAASPDLQFPADFTPLHSKLHCCLMHQM